ncbi:hypothetical protein ACM66B_006017 [Microbotryomycetes sp. NB124-2]
MAPLMPWLYEAARRYRSKYGARTGEILSPGGTLKVLKVCMPHNPEEQHGLMWLECCDAEKIVDVGIDALDVLNFNTSSQCKLGSCIGHFVDVQSLSFQVATPVDLERPHKTTEPTCKSSDPRVVLIIRNMTYIGPTTAADNLQESLLEYFHQGPPLDVQSWMDRLEARGALSSGRVLVSMPSSQSSRATTAPEVLSLDEPPSVALFRNRRARLAHSNPVVDGDSNKVAINALVPVMPAISVEQPKAANDDPVVTKKPATGAHQAEPTVVSAPTTAQVFRMRKIKVIQPAPAPRVQSTDSNAGMTLVRAVDDAPDAEKTTPGVAVDGSSRQTTSMGAAIEAPASASPLRARKLEQPERAPSAPPPLESVAPLQVTVERALSVDADRTNNAPKEPEPAESKVLAQPARVTVNHVKGPMSAAVLRKRKRTLEQSKSPAPVVEHTPNHAQDDLLPRDSTRDINAVQKTMEESYTIARDSTVSIDNARVVQVPKSASMFRDRKRKLENRSVSESAPPRTRELERASLKGIDRDVAEFETAPATANDFEKRSKRLMQQQPESTVDAKAAEDEEDEHMALHTIPPPSLAIEQHEPSPSRANDDSPCRPSSAAGVSNAESEAAQPLERSAMSRSSQRRPLSGTVSQRPAPLRALSNGVTSSRRGTTKRARKKQRHVVVNFADWLESIGASDALCNSTSRM